MPDKEKPLRSPRNFPHCEVEAQERDERRRLRAVEELNARTRSKPKD